MDRIELKLTFKDIEELTKFLEILKNSGMNFESDEIPLWEKLNASTDS